MSDALTQPVHVPALRAGREYTSLDEGAVPDLRTGEVRALVSQVNAGLIRRDLRRSAENAAALRRRSTEELLAITSRAAELFVEARLPLSEEDGTTQSPDDYVATLSATSGLPHSLVRANMKKVHEALAGMAGVLRGLSRGLDLSVLDHGLGEQAGVPVSFAFASDALGAVLPSNSPGVNSLWLPALALKTPVVLKPGRDEPWTPLRIVRAFLAAGAPPEAFSFYPTDHEGAAVILERCGRTILFGDRGVTERYAGDPRVEVHGPGYSKVLLGPDVVPGWEEHLDVLVDSVAANGGRSCINASTILVAGDGERVADALARRLAELTPLAPEDPAARLSAFANPEVARRVDAALDAALAKPGAEDVTARHRRGPRLVERDGATYLSPTLVRCDSLDHPLARTEYMFPFASVVEVAADELVAALGPSLVVTALTRDPGLTEALLAKADVQRLNLGPMPTSRVSWEQPHEGNLFEFLTTRRAIHREAGW